MPHPFEWPFEGEGHDVQWNVDDNETVSYAEIKNGRLTRACIWIVFGIFFHHIRTEVTFCQGQG